MRNMAWLALASGFGLFAACSSSSGTTTATSGGTTTGTATTGTAATTGGHGGQAGASTTTGAAGMAGNGQGGAAGMGTTSGAAGHGPGAGGAAGMGTGGAGGAAGMGTGGAGGAANVCAVTDTSVNNCTLAAAEDHTGQTMVTVTFTDFSYSPACILVDQGTTVTFSGAMNVHPLTPGPDCNQDTCGGTNPIPGNGGAVTFTAAGTFPYHCGNHCSMGMLGAVFVQ